MSTKLMTTLGGSMSSQTLAIIWFAIAATLGTGEILIAGSFYLAPFAVGALAAAITAALLVTLGKDL